MRAPYPWLGKLLGDGPSDVPQGLTTAFTESRSAVSECPASVHPATVAAGELESVVTQLRGEIAARHKDLSAIMADLQVARLESESESDGKLVQDQILPLCQQLSRRLTHAYDELRQKTEHLLSVAQIKIDPLTGLRNQHAMSEWISMMFAFLARYHHGFSLALVDVDQLQQLNHLQGRAEGDAALVYVAELLVANARETDVVFRYRGDQFVVALPETQLTESYVFAERVRSVVSAKTDLTVSVAVTAARDDDNLRTILNRVDAAIYGSKSDGGNCIYAHDGHAVELVDVAEPLPDSG